VLYGSAQTAPGLGYVDASHQALLSVPGVTELTYYRALGDLTGRADDTPLAPGVAGRRLLLSQPSVNWRDAILGELSAPHPDLAAKVSRIDITRYGHAMAVPVPSTEGKIDLQPRYNLRKQLQNSEHLQICHKRLNVAHSDWAGYSVFEEAFTLGHHAA
jgi:hypothetical protein